MFLYLNVFFLFLTFNPYVTTGGVINPQTDFYPAAPKLFTIVTIAFVTFPVYVRAKKL